MHLYTHILVLDLTVFYPLKNLTNIGRLMNTTHGSVYVSPGFNSLYIYIVYIHIR